MINTYSVDDIEININEVLRYMGCGHDVADEKVLNLAKKCIDEVKPKLTLKACYDKFKISSDGDKLDLGFTTVISKDLKKNLGNAKEVFLFVATVGVELDRLMWKYSLTSPAYATAIQAVGAAAIEQWCDILCEHLSESAGELCPRFSPGYGDLPLSLQQEILNTLDCGRKIGVSLTDSMLMLPTKSVSAIVGIK